jgi:ribosomal protein S18 acetylase RimI-like enzyme
VNALLEEVEANLHGVCSAVYLHVMASNSTALAFYDAYVDLPPE